MASFNLGHRLCCLLPVTILMLSAVSISADSPALAQESSATVVGGNVDRLIDAGEFPAALKIIESMPPAQADRWRVRLAQRQLEAGAGEAAFRSLQSVDDTGAIDDLEFGGGPMPGESSDDSQTGNRQGGITEADFQPLVDLIQSVIASDSWEDTGGEGSLLAFPAGVYVDTSGILKRIKPVGPRHKSLLHSTQQKLAFGSLSPPRQRGQNSQLRSISLKRLLREIKQTSAFGRPLDSSIKNMAGVYRIQYVMVDQESRDIVLAGPGGPWQQDAAGRSVNIETGRPVLQLDDLLVCLKNALTTGEQQGQFGCTIIPRQKSLAAARAFLTNTKLTGKQWADQLRDAVGRQDIEVSGISPHSHAAAVIVEADLLMKMIGMGVEPSIRAVPDYFDRVAGQKQTGQRDSLVRWWFTVDLDSIVTDGDQNYFELSGPTVKVLSENEHLNAQGKRIHSGQSDNATEGFARDFTDHFDEVCQRYPVFAQLQNVFELAIVAGIIGQFELDQKVGLRDDLDRHFLAADGAGQGGSPSNYWPGALPFSGEVESIMNYRQVTFSNGGKRYRQRLVAVSGGVEFNFSKATAKSDRTERSRSAFPVTRPELQEPHAWWWD